jgi:aspartyl-tRNA(Asn)/glutamyl-tRNA(Gln) amidotransferase subunit A
MHSAWPRVLSGATSCEAVLLECLARRDAGGALVARAGPAEGSELAARARAADARRREGRALGGVDGMAVVVKDNLCATEWPTTAGSRMLAGFRAPYDACAVERLRRGGALLVGKSNMDEFGMGSFGTSSAFGPCTVPPAGGDDGSAAAVARRRVAGGSSSGSAAAVAQGLCVAALGSDTGGSVRLPAAFCGVVGVKPSYGRVSRWGLISYASSLDTVGVLAGSVAEAAAILDCIAGPDERDATAMKEPWPGAAAALAAAELGAVAPRLRVGVPAEFFLAETPREALGAWRAAAEALAAGAEVVPVSVPSVLDSLPAYYVIACAEASSNLARYDGVRFGHRAASSSFPAGAAGAAAPREALSLHQEYSRTRTEGFGAEVRRRLLTGALVLSSESYDDLYLRALAVRRRLRADFARAFQAVDVLVTPVSPAPAPTLANVLAGCTDPVQAYLTDVMTVPASLAGLPAATVPLRGGAGAVQLMAASGRDDVLLLAAALLECSARGCGQK